VAASYQRDAFLERRRKYIDESTAAARQALLNMKASTPDQKKRATELSALLEKNKQLMADQDSLQHQHDAIGQKLQNLKETLGPKTAPAKKA